MKTHKKQKRKGNAAPSKTLSKNDRIAIKVLSGKHVKHKDIAYIMECSEEKVTPSVG